MASTAIEFLFVLIAHAVSAIYSSTLKYRRKTTFFIWGFWIAIQGFLLFFEELLSAGIVLQFVVGFVFPLIGHYAIFLATTKGNISQRIFTLLTYSTFFCISMSLFSMVKGTFHEMNPFLVSGLNGLMLFGIVYYFLRYICPLCRTAAKTITTGWRLLIFVNVFFMIMLILSSVFPVRLTNFHDPGTITFFFLSVSIAVVYPVIFSNINHLSELASKREVERQNKLLLAQIETESLQLEADRQARHDRRHHNLVMLEFANNNDIENVREYLKNLVKSESSVLGDVKHCSHMTINTVLTVYERRAKEQDISVTISAAASRDINILPQDLVIIIANLFENAIHAAAKLPDKQKCIDISIKESTQRLLIKVENPCRNNLSFDETLYGVGIHSVIAAVNKYDGMYDFSAEDGIFTARISLNLQ